MAFSISFLAYRPRIPTAVLSLASGAFLMLGMSGSPLAAGLPKHFHKNASRDIGSGLQCVAGTATDDDGMNGRAHVYVEDTRTHAIQWAASIPLRKGWYQNQATHCLGDGQKVYALVQSETTSQASLSQTFISVVTMNRMDGHIDSVSPVRVPGVHGAVSAWVGEEPEHFAKVDGKIVVTGEYLLMNNRDDIKPFIAHPEDITSTDASPP